MEATPPPISPLGSLTKAVALAALMIIAGLFALKVVVPDIRPKRLAEVIPGKIYRSAELSPAALENLAKQAHLKTIIDLGIAPDGEPRDRRQQLAAQALGLTRYKFHLIGDSTGNPNEYVAALRLALDPSNQPVLIHCATGSQRTSCAIALLRMADQQVSLDQALAEAREFDAKAKVDDVLRSISSPVVAAVKEGRTIPGFPPIEAKPVPSIRARP